MGLFNRISATIVSTVDKAVTRVENHDAIIESSIRQTRQVAARARVRLARVRKDGESLRARLEELQASETAWSERARSAAETDKDKALECLRRRRACSVQIEKLGASLRQHQELEAQVAGNLQKIETRLKEISEQRNMMRSRQSVAEALRVINHIEGSATSEIEDTFDRWEILISESELAIGEDVAIDPLESTFIETEDSASLREELDALLKGQEDKNDG